MAADNPKKMLTIVVDLDIANAALEFARANGLKNMSTLVRTLLSAVVAGEVEVDDDGRIKPSHRPSSPTDAERTSPSAVLRSTADRLLTLAVTIDDEVA